MKSIFTLIVSCLLLSACGEQAPKSAFPAEMNVVYDDHADPAVLGQVVTRSEVLRADAVTANFEFVKVDPKCRAPRASRRAKVAYVYTYGGHNEVPVHHVEAENNKAANALRQEFMNLAISEMTDNSFTAGMMGREFAQFQMSNQLESPGRIEVLITETDAPVFLYLSSYNSVLWNIQLAPGAELDGVVVDAYEGGIVANGATAKRTAFKVYSKINGVRCRTKTFGRPIPVKERIAGAIDLNPNFDASRYEDDWKHEYKMANEFFQRTLPKLTGKKPDWILTNARGGDFKAVLVGPVPSAPFEPQPIQRLQMPESVQPFWGTRLQALDYFGLRVSG